nr:enoyl-CoA hydratase-related protein [Fusobacterium nucleatum]
MEILENIALITMNRPKAMNALNNETLKELFSTLKYIEKNKNIWGVILTGEGKAFVAGADISQMKDYSSENGRKYADYAQKIFNFLENLEKPIIAAINGYALGGGCELAMSCDLRIASEKAIFGQPEVNLGVIPCFGGTQRLSRLIGVGRAKDLIYTGRLINVEEAFQFGLVNKIVDSEKLLEEAINFMKKILEKAPIALRYSKVAINTGINLDLHNALELEKDLAALCFGTKDKTEGMYAFLEKRKANFTNE